MKSMIILRGLNTTDKERLNWIKSQGLEIYTISIDDIKKLYSSPEALSEKYIKLTRLDDSEILWRFYEALELKLRKGCLVIVNDENIKLTKINKLSELARTFGYKVFVKSFQVSEKILKDFSSKKIDSFFQVETQDEVLSKVIDYLNSSANISTIHGITEINTIEDVREYWRNDKRYTIEIPENVTIVNIGDIHGYGDLIQKDNLITEGLRDKLDLIYVFHGDYIDRGPKSRETLDYVLNLKRTYPNQVYLLEGNHEVHLRRYLSNIKNPKTGNKDFFKIVCHEFSSTTMKEFDKLSDLERDEYIENLNKYLQTHLVIKRGEETYFCTHAGFSSYRQLEFDLIGNVIYGNRNMNEYDRKVSKMLSKNHYSIHAHCKYTRKEDESYETCKYPGVINLDPERDGDVMRCINEYKKELIVSNLKN